MNAEQTDIVVVGMGPGGEGAAGRLAQVGLHVTGVEARLVGGEPAGRGRRIPGIAGQSTVNPDWTVVATRIREEAADSWNGKIAVDRFTGKGGHFVRGRGRIAGQGEVTVDTADGPGSCEHGIMLNPGTKPVIPLVQG